MDFFNATELRQMVRTLGDDTRAVFAVGTPEEPAEESAYTIFDGAYRLVDLGIGAESSAPAITVVAADVTGIAAHGVAVTVKDKAGALIGAYTIQNIQPERKDGKGLVILILTEA